MSYKVSKGVGVNTGVVSGEIVIINSPIAFSEDTNKKILVINEHYLIELAVFIKPLGIITPLGGYVSHIQSLFSGTSTKLALGVDAEWVSSLRNKEKITICNKYDNSSLVYSSDIDLISESNVSNIRLPQNKLDVYISAWSAAQVNSFSSENIKGICLVQSEILSEVGFRSLFRFDDPIQKIEKGEMWEEINLLAKSNSRHWDIFQDHYYTNLVGLLKFSTGKSVKIRLPDWGEQHDNRKRGISRLLLPHYRYLTDAFLNILVYIHNKYPNTEIVLPYVDNVADYDEFIEYLKYYSWEGMLNLMIESPFEQLAKLINSKANLSSVVVGLADYSSQLLNYSRENNSVFLTSESMNALALSVDEITMACKSFQLPCVLGGLTAEKLLEFNHILRNQPTGYFYKPDYLQLLDLKIVL